MWFSVNVSKCMTSPINLFMFISKKENYSTILVTLKSVSGFYQLRFLSHDFGCFNVRSAKQLQFNLKANLNSLASRHTLHWLLLCTWLLHLCREQKKTDWKDPVERSFEHYKITLDHKKSAAFSFYWQSIIVQSYGFRGHLKEHIIQLSSSISKERSYKRDKSGLLQK